MVFVPLCLCAIEFPAKYEAQLVAGYSRNTPRKGLQVFMPDYSQVAAKGGILKPPRLP